MARALKSISMLWKELAKLESGKRADLEVSDIDHLYQDDVDSLHANMDRRDIRSQSYIDMKASRERRQKLLKRQNRRRKHNRKVLQKSR